MGFIRCRSDRTYFTRRTLSGQVIIMSAYVDDIVITGYDVMGIAQVKKDLDRFFLYKRSWGSSIFSYLYP